MDGEIIWEPTGFKYYVHDIACVCGKVDVAKLSYTQRIQHIQELLRWNAFPPDNPAQDTITLLPKQVFQLAELPNLWTNVIPKLRHRCDGLILTPDALPHTGKKNKLLFKWKHTENHTLDLMAQPSGTMSRSGALTFQLMTWDTVDLIPFTETTMPIERWKAIGIEDPRNFQGKGAARPLGPPARGC